MNGADDVCPSCGAKLAPELSDRSRAGVWLGRCENQHWWLHSPMFGWMPADPKVLTAVGGVTMDADESC